MTSVRSAPHYEDHLTYPMVIGHHIREVEGRVIKNWARNASRTVSYGEYQDLLDRIEQLENQVRKLQNG